MNEAAEGGGPMYGHSAPQSAFAFGSFTNWSITSATVAIR
jgi:hypothetical protein